MASTRLVGKVGLSARVLDRLLDDVLHLIPVTGIDAINLALEVLLDLAQHLPLVAVRNKGDSHSNTAETTSTADTVKISLVIGFALAAGLVQLGNVLENRSAVLTSIMWEFGLT